MFHPQRPLTYGEYRKMREDFERRFAPQPPVGAPAMAAEPPAPEPTVPPASPAPPPVNKRDPRRQPREPVVVSNESAAEKVSGVVSIFPVEK
jgi:hypothetical protein